MALLATFRAYFKCLGAVFGGVMIEFVALVANEDGGEFLSFALKWGDSCVTCKKTISDDLV